MLELFKQTITSQFEAALAMLNACIAACPPAHWEGKIANDLFRYVAYHTLFYADLYLSRSEEAFQLRELHHRGGDERGEAASPGLSKEETLAYVPIVRQKLLESLAAETEQSLAGPSGFSWRKFSRRNSPLQHSPHPASRRSAQRLHASR